VSAASTPAVIRPAGPQDVGVIAALIRELAEYERLVDEVSLDETLLAKHLFGPRPFIEALLAEVEDRPAGFALFFHNYSTFLGRPGIYLEDLFVRSEYRSRGIGRALLQELARLAVERGCGRLEWAVLDWNLPAIGFYEKLGARPNSEWTTYRLSGEALSALGSI
jgi:GNAT superfamily N-acetyltransferase